MKDRNSKKTLFIILGMIVLGHAVFWTLAAWLYFSFAPWFRDRDQVRTETVLVVTEPATADEPTDVDKPTAVDKLAVTESPAAEPVTVVDPVEEIVSSTTEPAVSATPTAENDAVPVEPVESADERTVVTADELSENQKKVIAYVEKVRGLTAAEPLQIVYLTRDELQREITAVFESEVTDEDIAIEKDLLTLLGFIPSDFDIREFYTQLYTEQIAGYYNNKENIMMLPKEADESEILRTLSHEYTHFLQFNNFPELKTYYDSDYCEENNEQCLLGRAVIEGDAVLTETLVGQDQEMMRMMRSDSASKSNEISFFSQAPLFYQESILMDYSYGFTFVYNYFMRDGFDGVNRLLREPPTSVEQLIHPEKYRSDDPIPVSIGIFDDVFEANGCTLDQDGILNELDLRWLMTIGTEKRWRLDSRTAIRATEGWGGGTFRSGRCGGEPFLFSETQWDSRRDANEFFETMEDYFGARFGDPVGTDTWSSKGQQRIRLESSDNSVFFMIVPEDFDLSEIETLIGEIEYSEDVAL